MPMVIPWGCAVRRRAALPHTAHSVAHVMCMGRTIHTLSTGAPQSCWSPSSSSSSSSHRDTARPVNPLLAREDDRGAASHTMPLPLTAHTRNASYSSSAPAAERAGGHKLDHVTSAAVQHSQAERDGAAVRRLRRPERSRNRTAPTTYAVANRAKRDDGGVPVSVTAPVSANSPHREQWIWLERWLCAENTKTVSRSSRRLPVFSLRGASAPSLSRWPTRREDRVAAEQATHSNDCCRLNERTSAATDTTAAAAAADGPIVSSAEVTTHTVDTGAGGVCLPHRMLYRDLCKLARALHEMRHQQGTHADMITLRDELGAYFYSLYTALQPSPPSLDTTNGAVNVVAVVAEGGGRGAVPPLPQLWPVSSETAQRIVTVTCALAMAQYKGGLCDAAAHLLLQSSSSNNNNEENEEGDQSLVRRGDWTGVNRRGAPLTRGAHARPAAAAAAAMRESLLTMHVLRAVQRRVSTQRLLHPLPPPATGSLVVPSPSSSTSVGSPLTVDAGGVVYVHALNAYLVQQLFPRVMQRMGGLCAEGAALDTKESTGAFTGTQDATTAFTAAEMRLFSVLLTALTKVLSARLLLSPEEAQTCDVYQLSSCAAATLSSPGPSFAEVVYTRASPCAAGAVNDCDAAAAAANDDADYGYVRLPHDDPRVSACVTFGRLPLPRFARGVRRAAQYVAQATRDGAGRGVDARTVLPVLQLLLHDADFARWMAVSSRCADSSNHTSHTGNRNGVCDDAECANHEVNDVERCGDRANDKECPSHRPSDNKMDYSSTKPHHHHANHSECHDPCSHNATERAAMSLQYADAMADDAAVLMRWLGQSVAVLTLPQLATLAGLYARVAADGAGEPRSWPSDAEGESSPCAWTASAAHDPCEQQPRACALRRKGTLHETRSRCGKACPPLSLSLCQTRLRARLARRVREERPGEVTRMGRRVCERAKQLLRTTSAPSDLAALVSAVTQMRRAVRRGRRVGCVLSSAPYDDTSLHGATTKLCYETNDKETCSESTRSEMGGGGSTRANSETVSMCSVGTIQTSNERVRHITCSPTKCSSSSSTEKVNDNNNNNAHADDTQSLPGRLNSDESDETAEDALWCVAVQELIHAAALRLRAVAPNLISLRSLHDRNNLIDTSSSPPPPHAPDARSSSLPQTAHSYRKEAKLDPSPPSASASCSLSSSSFAASAWAPSSLRHVPEYVFRQLGFRSSRLTYISQPTPPELLTMYRASLTDGRVYPLVALTDVTEACLSSRAWRRYSRPAVHLGLLTCLMHDYQRGVRGTWPCLHLPRGSGAGSDAHSRIFFYGSWGIWSFARASCAMPTLSISAPVMSYTVMSEEEKDDSRTGGSSSMNTCASTSAQSIPVDDNVNTHAQTGSLLHTTLDKAEVTDVQCSNASSSCNAQSLTSASSSSSLFASSSFRREEEGYEEGCVTTMCARLLRANARAVLSAEEDVVTLGQLKQRMCRVRQQLCEEGNHDDSLRSEEEETAEGRTDSAGLCAWWSSSDLPSRWLLCESDECAYEDQLLLTPRFLARRVAEREAAAAAARETADATCPNSRPDEAKQVQRSNAVPGQASSFDMSHAINHDNKSTKDDNTPNTCRVIHKNDPSCHHCDPPTHHHHLSSDGAPTASRIHVCNTDSHAAHRSLSDTLATTHSTARLPRLLPHSSAVCGLRDIIHALMEVYCPYYTRDISPSACIYHTRSDISVVLGVVSRLCHELSLSLSYSPPHTRSTTAMWASQRMRDEVLPMYVILHRLRYDLFHHGYTVWPAMSTRTHRLVSDDCGAGGGLPCHTAKPEGKARCSTRSTDRVLLYDEEREEDVYSWKNNERMMSALGRAVAAAHDTLRMLLYQQLDWSNVPPDSSSSSYSSSSAPILSELTKRGDTADHPSRTERHATSACETHKQPIPLRTYTQTCQSDATDYRVGSSSDETVGRAVRLMLHLHRVPDESPHGRALTARVTAWAERALSVASGATLARLLAVCTDAAALLPAASTSWPTAVRWALVAEVSRRGGGALTASPLGDNRSSDSHTSHDHVREEKKNDQQGDHLCGSLAHDALMTAVLRTGDNVLSWASLPHVACVRGRWGATEDGCLSVRHRSVMRQMVEQCRSFADWVWVVQQLYLSHAELLCTSGDRVGCGDDDAHGQTCTSLPDATFMSNTASYRATADSNTSAAAAAAAVHCSDSIDVHVDTHAPGPVRSSGCVPRNSRPRDDADVLAALKSRWCALWHCPTATAESLCWLLGILVRADAAGVQQQQEQQSRHRRASRFAQAHTRPAEEESLFDFVVRHLLQHKHTVHTRLLQPPPCPRASNAPSPSFSSSSAAAARADGEEEEEESAAAMEDSFELAQRSLRPMAALQFLLTGLRAYAGDDRARVRAASVSLTRTTSALHGEGAPYHTFDTGHTPPCGDDGIAQTHFPLSSGASRTIASRPMSPFVCEGRANHTSCAVPAAVLKERMQRCEMLLEQVLAAWMLRAVSAVRPMVWSSARRTEWLESCAWLAPGLLPRMIAQVYWNECEAYTETSSSSASANASAASGSPGCNRASSKWSAARRGGFGASAGFGRALAPALVKYMQCAIWMEHTAARVRQRVVATETGHTWRARVADGQTRTSSTRRAATGVTAARAGWLNELDDDGEEEPHTNDRHDGDEEEDDMDRFFVSADTMHRYYNTRADATHTSSHASWHDTGSTHSSSTSLPTALHDTQSNSMHCEENNQWQGNHEGGGGMDDVHGRYHCHRRILQRMHRTVYRLLDRLHSRDATVVSTEVLVQYMSTPSVQQSGPLRWRATRLLLRQLQRASAETDDRVMVLRQNHLPLRKGSPSDTAEVTVTRLWRPFRGSTEDEDYRSCSASSSGSSSSSSLCRRYTRRTRGDVSVGSLYACPTPTRLRAPLQLADSRASRQGDWEACATGVSKWARGTTEADEQQKQQQQQQQQQSSRGSCSLHTMQIGSDAGYGEREETDRHDDGCGYARAQGRPLPRVYRLVTAEVWRMLIESHRMAQGASVRDGDGGMTGSSSSFAKGSSVSLHSRNSNSSSSSNRVQRRAVRHETWMEQRGHTTSRKEEEKAASSTTVTTTVDAECADDSAAGARMVLGVLSYVRALAFFARWPSDYVVALRYSLGPLAFVDLVTELVTVYAKHTSEDMRHNIDAVHAAFARRALDDRQATRMCTTRQTTEKEERTNDTLRRARTRANAPSPAESRTRDLHDTIAQSGVHDDCTRREDRGVRADAAQSRQPRPVSKFGAAPACVRAEPSSPSSLRTRTWGASLAVPDRFDKESRSSKDPTTHTHSSLSSAWCSYSVVPRDEHDAETRRTYDWVVPDSALGEYTDALLSPFMYDWLRVAWDVMADLISPHTLWRVLEPHDTVHMSAGSAGQRTAITRRSRDDEDEYDNEEYEGNDNEDAEELLPSASMPKGVHAESSATPSSRRRTRRLPSCDESLPPRPPAGPRGHASQTKRILDLRVVMRFLRLIEQLQPALQTRRALCLTCPTVLPNDVAHVSSASSSPTAPSSADNVCHPQPNRSYASHTPSRLLTCATFTSVAPCDLLVAVLTAAQAHPLLELCHVTALMNYHDEGHSLPSRAVEDVASESAVYEPWNAARARRQRRRVRPGMRWRCSSSTCCTLDDTNNTRPFVCCAMCDRNEVNGVRCDDAAATSSHDINDSSMRMSSRVAAVLRRDRDMLDAAVLRYIWPRREDAHDHHNHTHNENDAPLESSGENSANAPRAGLAGFARAVSPLAPSALTRLLHVLLRMMPPPSQTPSELSNRLPCMTGRCVRVVLERWVELVDSALAEDVMCMLAAVLPRWRCDDGSAVHATGQDTALSFTSSSSSSSSSSVADTQAACASRMAHTGGDDVDDESTVLLRQTMCRLLALVPVVAAHDVERFSDTQLFHLVASLHVGRWLGDGSAAALVELSAATTPVELSESLVPASVARAMRVALLSGDNGVDAAAPQLAADDEDRLCELQSGLEDDYNNEDERMAVAVEACKRRDEAMTEWRAVMQRQAEVVARGGAPMEATEQRRLLIRLLRCIERINDRPSEKCTAIP